MPKLELINILRKDKKIQEFLENSEKVAPLYNKLNKRDLELLKNGFPDLLTSGPKLELNIISTLTLIKKDSSAHCYKKLKKLKFYFNETNQEIFRFLES